MTTPPALLSVVVVSDYAGGTRQAWRDLGRTLAALTAQVDAPPFEVVVAEATADLAALPPDLVPPRPGWRLVGGPDHGSYALKNAGVAAATAPLVAMLDADCAPNPHWVRTIVRFMRERPDVAVVSGRTTYADPDFDARALALLTRSYVDPGRAGATAFVANNNAAFRRDVWLAHPLPEDVGPFGARMQSEAIRRSGGRLWFEPAMRVTHEFEGWPMECDIRRNIGYGTILTRLRDARLPWAWLARLGPASIPLIVAGKTIDSFRDVWRCHHEYRVRTRELPRVCWLAIRVHLLEVAGMIAAFRERPLSATAYR